jgi:putative tryptophan/tyrosine transport system substrate-binding protein
LRYGRRCSWPSLRHVAGAAPIVFVDVSDPVAQGFVHDLARPGGNITGFANYDYAMAGKWLQLLREIAPHMKRTAVLYAPKIASWPGFFRAIQSAANAASIDAVAVVCEKPSDIPRLAALGPGPSTGLILLPGAGTGELDALIEMSARLRLPVISGWPLYTTRGGLMTYTGNPISAMHSGASYVDRILHGEKPGDLPVQDPTSFVLTINLKTAKALGLVVPQSLLVSANELIR